MSDLDSVARALVGFVPAAASPTADPTRLGSATLDVQGDRHAAGLAQLTIRYVVGHHGVDDRGALKLVWRFPADGGPLQFDDPQGLNYVTAEATCLDEKGRAEGWPGGSSRSRGSSSRSIRLFPQEAQWPKSTGPSSFASASTTRVR